ncbi:MAG: four helix bundle protein [Vicinamibacteria bacterium]
MALELISNQEAGASAPAVSAPDVRTGDRAGSAARLAAQELPESWLPGGSRQDGDPEASFVMEAERMRVYQLALELQCHANTLVPSVNRIVRDQFERASLSIVLNSAEAFGRYSRKQKRYHVAVARGSAMECAAVCDVLRVRRLAPEVECVRAKRLAVRCVQMLSKLEQALSKPSKEESEAG